MKRMKVVRTSKTKVTHLPSYKTEKAKASDEPSIDKDEVQTTESSLGDMFEDLYGEKLEEVDPATVSSGPKRHVRRDDEPDELAIAVQEPEKPKYIGRPVNEGVTQDKAANVESSELDDLINQVMDAPAEDISPKRPTSTPTKEDANDADFGDGLSLIRGDDEPVGDDKSQEKPEEPKRRDEESGGKPYSSGTYGGYKSPSRGGGTTTTTIKASYSSKFVPNIPASFYKDLQARLEDLIFKFECLDNEYAALQKISHNVHEETTEIKKKFSI